MLIDIKSKGNKSKNKQVEPHQTKKLLPSKENHQKNEKKWEKILANHISDKRLIFKIYKELKQPNGQKKKKFKQYDF